MRRGAFNILAGLSLAFFAVVAALWMRSYAVTDYITCDTTEGFRWSVGSEQGLLAYWKLPIGARPREVRQWERLDRPIDVAGKIGFDSLAYDTFSVGYWQTAIWSAILPLIWLGRSKQMAFLRRPLRF